MKTAAFAVAHHAFFTRRPEHRTNLGSAVYIVERCAPELLHTFRPLDRIAAGRDEHPFQAAEVAPGEKIHLLTERREPRQINGRHPEVVRLKRPHALNLRL